MAKVKDVDLYEQLRALGYHVPDHCIDLTLDAPMNSVVTVTCTYHLYKEKEIDVDWGDARKYAKRELEMVSDITKEDMFLEGVGWAIKRIKRLLEE